MYLASHSDCVCKVATGKRRSRTPLREAKTLCKLRDIVQRRISQARQASALPEDPMAACENSAEDVLATPWKRRRRSVSSLD